MFVVADDHHSVITRHIDTTAAQVKVCLQLRSQADRAVAATEMS